MRRAILSLSYNFRDCALLVVFFAVLLLGMLVVARNHYDTTDRQNLAHSMIGAPESIVERHFGRPQRRWTAAEFNAIPHQIPDKFGPIPKPERGYVRQHYERLTYFFFFMEDGRTVDVYTFRS